MINIFHGFEPGDGYPEIYLNHEPGDILKYEKLYQSQGYIRIVGLDEAGRGPLAGPVVAVALFWGNSKIIDDHRNEAIFSLKKFNINKNSKIKILHVFNRAEKIGGRIYFISTGKKIENGLIRLGHDVEGISDRDILSYNSKINARQTLNRIFLEKSLYYRPDIILLGHVNTIDDESFSTIKNVNKNTIFSQWYEDNLTVNGPDFEKNYSNLKTNFKYLDNFFISTHPDDVSKKSNSKKYHFLPTPVDRNIEKFSFPKSIYFLIFYLYFGTIKYFKQL